MTILLLKYKMRNLSKNNKNFDETNLKQTLNYFKIPTIDDLYFRIGKGNLDPLKVLHAIYPTLRGKASFDIVIVSCVKSPI